MEGIETYFDKAIEGCEIDLLEYLSNNTISKNIKDLFSSILKDNVKKLVIYNLAMKNIFFSIKETKIDELIELNFSNDNLYDIPSQVIAKDSLCDVLITVDNMIDVIDNLMVKE